MKQDQLFNWMKECERLEAINKRLLEGCKGALAFLEMTPVYQNSVQFAVDLAINLREAITKAEGEK